MDGGQGDVPRRNPSPQTQQHSMEFCMSRPRLGTEKKLNRYEAASAQRRAEMQRHFESLAAACFRWRAEHEHDDFLLVDHCQGMAGKDGEKKC
jgi:hypothetical protein